MIILIKALILLGIVLFITGITAVSGFGFPDTPGPAFVTPLPGAEPFDTSLIKRFEQKRASRGKGYRPRTKHLRPDGWAMYTNRLFLESSPYLLQHAHNPVNWYPWGDEAFAAAKRLNRPVFLSIGYSTCHWCHVMEEESFEDTEIARYLNENYIAVKVDREERPDVDAVYMRAVQVLTGRGGWPLNAWLTPDRKPFYGGSYFPSRDGDRGIAMGFLSLLKRLNAAYHQQGDRVAETGRQITAAIRQAMAMPPGTGLPARTIMDQAAQFYKNSYDPKNGGLDGAPKFPSSLPVGFLLRYYRITGDPQILEMVRHSLVKMAEGGIYDHIGGGFHRYSTDERWLVPHFEKMLYDNALLAIAYLEAYQVTGDNGFKQVVNEILTYVKRDMTAPKGAFYSATDADSPTPEGGMAEGYFFTWTPAELEAALGKDRAETIKTYFSVSASGNFEGRNILHIERPVSETARLLNMSEKRLRSVISEAKEKLYRVRNRRPHPLRDEKILTAWNGLMISAFARAGLILNDPAYTATAETATRFIFAHLYIDNRLYRSYTEGQPRHEAYLNDYAFLIAALIDLYEADHDITWLKTAMQLDKILEKKFEDRQNGGFFMSGTSDKALIAREKPYEDGAIPSGNTAAIINLLHLGGYTTDDRYRQRAKKALTAFQKPLQSYPSALSGMLAALDFYLDEPLEIVIITPAGEKRDADIFLDRFRALFIPWRVIVVADEQNAKTIAETIPMVEGKTLLNGKATAYVCEKGACKLPTNNPEVFARQLEVNLKKTGCQ